MVKGIRVNLAKVRVVAIAMNDVPSVLLRRTEWGIYPLMLTSWCRQCMQTLRGTFIQRQAYCAVVAIVGQSEAPAAYSKFIMYILSSFANKDDTMALSTSDVFKI
jgi:hypothetical protein